MGEKQLTIEIEGRPHFRVRVRPELTDTTRAMFRSVPFESSAERWGDEVYFSAPFHSALEDDAKAEMEVGEVAFWPQGDAIALFFGRTPASIDAKPRAYSPCNRIGFLEGDLSALKSVKEGTRIRVVVQ